MSSNDLRPVEPMETCPANRVLRNPIAPPPKIAWLALDQLVIDGSYQRDLSRNSRALILKMVSNWDWDRFKPLSVAPVGDGRYEVIDGQHTAIAAATHGAVETLPCLVLSAATRSDRANAFVAINRDRIRLTPFALYRARVAGGDPEAEAVDAAICESGAQLVETIFRDRDDYEIGTVACISTLLQIARTGGKARLRRLLNIAIRGEAQVIHAGLLKGLAVIITGDTPPSDDELAHAIREAGADILAERASAGDRLGGPGNTSIKAWERVLREEVARNRRVAA